MPSVNHVISPHWMHWISRLLNRDGVLEPAPTPRLPLQVPVHVVLLPGSCKVSCHRGREKKLQFPGSQHPQQRLHARILPCLWSPPVPKLALTAEVRYDAESKEHVTLFELIWWHAVAGLNTNYHVSSDKSGGKKRWSFNKFIMKANDSYINQTASLRGKLSQLNTEVTEVNSTVVTPPLVSFLLSSRDDSLLQQCLVLPSPALRQEWHFSRHLL